jgi:hypothetical protein
MNDTVPPNPPPTIETPPHVAAPPPLRERRFDLAIAIGVLLISLISLFVAFSANRTQERMLAASVWPSLQFGTSNIGQDGSEQLTFDLLNRGVGPARLRWAELSFGEEPVRNLADYLARCCGQTTEIDAFSSGLRRRVLGSDEWIHVIRVPRASVSDPLWESLDRARHQVRFRACYCSVLDDCWVLDSQVDEPEPVAQCPAAPTVVWGS